MSSSIGIIGGADGPTAVFITGDPLAAIFWIGGTVVLVLLAVRYFRKKK